MTIIEETYSWSGAFTDRTTTELIILHHAAGDGSAQDVHRWHLANGWIGIGYHYYIRKDGAVYRGRPEHAVGAQAVGYNYNSVAICFEGNFETEHMNETQLKAGAELIADIEKRYVGLRILGHKAVDATACPGVNFPLAELLAADDLPETDIGPDAWAKEAADWAVAKRLFVGDGNGELHWREPVTRQELAVVLLRFAEMMGTENTV